MGSNDDVDLAVIIDTGAMNIGFLVDALDQRAIVDFSLPNQRVVLGCCRRLSGIVAS